jgi:hypothetical protein
MNAVRIVLLLLAVMMVLLRYTADAQEDVLRPNGRGTDARVQQDDAPVIRVPGPILRVGIEGGLTYATLSRTIDGILPTSPYSIASSGSGVDVMYGVYAEVELSPMIALGMRLMVDNRRISATRDGLLQDCLILDEYGVPQSVSVVSLRGEYERTQSFVTFTPLLRLSITDRLFAQVGSTIQLPTSKISTAFTLTIPDSEPCSFNYGQPDSTKVSTSTSEETDYPALRLGLDVAIGYRIPLFDGLELVPRVGYQFMLSSFDGEAEGIDYSREYSDPPPRAYTSTASMMNHLQASLSLWFRL